MSAMAEDFFAMEMGDAPTGGKPTLLFVHGAGLDHTVWTPLTRYFTRHGYHTLAVDLPAHGKAPGAPLTSIPAMADWLKALMDARELENVVVIGHSMGCLAALDLAARHPNSVRGLALLGVTVPMPVASPLREAAATNPPLAHDMLTQWGYSRQHCFGGNPNAGIWMTGSTFAVFRRGQPGALAADLNACNDYVEGIERAALVDCPVQLILGQEDRLTPVATTRALQDALPSARVHVVQGGGHTLMVEATRETIITLAEFLRTLDNKQTA